MSSSEDHGAPGGLDGFAIWLANSVIALRWLVVAAALVITGYMATGLSKLEFSSNYRVFFSNDNPELQAFEALQEKYTKTDNFLFVIVPQDGSEIFSNTNLSAIQQLTDGAWQLPYSSRVDSISNFQYTYAIEDDLIVEDLAPATGSYSDEELGEKRRLALAEPLLNGQLITADARATAVNVTLTYPELALSEVPEAVAAARALRAEIQAAYPQLEIYLTGTSMLNNAFSEAVMSDFQYLVPLMALIILITTLIAVRSAWATVATFVLVILSTIIAMGWAGFVGVKLAGPSPSAVVIIMTLAIADSIHILITARGAMRRGMEKREAIVEAIRVNFLAVSITSVTTIVGFLVLNFSDAPPFRDLGNISSVGILSAWLLSLTLLPALLAIVPYRASAVDVSTDRSTVLGAFADIVIAHHRKLLFVVGAGSIALVSFIPRLELSDQFGEYFDPRIEFRTDSDAAREYFGFYPLEYSVAASGPGGVTDPEFLKTLDAFAGWLREQPRVTHVYSIADIMKRLNKNLNADHPEFYRLPEDNDLSAQYLLLFELSLPYGLDLNDRINIDKSETRLTATLDGEITTKQIRTLLADAESWFAENTPGVEAPPTGAQIMFTFIAERNVKSMVGGTVIAIFLIAGTMVLALRSAPMGALSMVPNGLPILSAFGAWALINGELGFSAAAVAPISLGIVIDDTVHFLTKYTRARRELRLDGPGSVRYAFETVGLALIVNTFILLSGFLIFTFSAFKINAEMGLFTSLAIGFALILDFLVLPGILLMLAARSDKKSLALSGEDNAKIRFSI